MRPTNIVIKTEREVETVLGIKRESDSNNSGSSGSHFIPTPNTNTWPQEKQSLIAKFMALKAENQRTLFDLKKSNGELEKLAIENRSLTVKLHEYGKIHSNQMVQLQTELKESNAALKRMNDDNMKRVMELTREKDLFRAQFKQLQKGLAQPTVTKEENNSDPVDAFYEVQRLLDDEMVQTRRLLVHHMIHHMIHG